MPLMAELELDDPQNTAPRCMIGSRACVIGRSGACDYVIDRTTVSREHAAVWVQGDKVHVRDLRSRNGTFVNEERVDAATLADGDLLRLGTEIRFRVRVRADGGRPLEQHRLALEDVDAGIRFLLDAQPVRIGSAYDADVRVAGEPVAAIVVAPRPGEAWLGKDDDTVELARGATFEVGGRTFRIVELEADPGATASATAMPWPYVIDAQFDGDRVRAVVHDAGGGRRHELAGTNRAVLMYLLARQWARDAADELDPEERGWSEDEDLAVGVWGRDGRGRSLKVLVCRLRSELREAGFDPWFIEKRRGGLRIRVRDAKAP
jgi:hypothetical protein